MSRIRCVVYTLLALAVLGMIGASAVVGLGLYNVSAATGHLPGVSWILHTTFRNSVALRAPPPETVPDLDAEGLSELGAGHYDSACKMCHGAPGVARSATVRAMTPEPPPIREAVAHWEPAELFWIVKNGVKMSGMPAWPTQKRDSDVWAVVAFLVDVAAMEPPAYAAMTAAPTDAPSPTLAGCAVCHGLDGRGHGNPQVPRLDTLTPAYIAASLEAYRVGVRFSGVMQQAASGLDDDQIADLATHYGDDAANRADPGMGTAGAATGDERVQVNRDFSDPEGRVRPRKPPIGIREPSVDPARQPHLVAGAAAARAVIFGRTGAADEAACAACHGPWPEALPALNPRLAGQRRAYLVEQLMLWKQGARGGSERARLMHEVIPALEDGEIGYIADFYAGLDD